MNTKTYCPNCEDYRETDTRRSKESYTVRGECFEVDATVAVCKHCGESIFDEERDEAILQELFARYRKRKGLLFPDEIKEVRERYGLSQKAFATLLGMSEATINRYERGGLQDEAHDNAIRFCDKRRNMRLLMHRRGHLLTPLQRQRAADALAAISEPIGTRSLFAWSDEAYEPSLLTGFRTFDYQRYVALVSWFCQRLRAVPATKMNKLLFYADFLSFRVRAVSLTGSTYRKLQHGPVPADYGSLRDRMEIDGFIRIEEKDYGGGCIADEYQTSSKSDEVTLDFDALEQAVLDTVAKTFGRMSAKAISARSHEETAWLNTADKALISYVEASELSIDLPAASRKATKAKAPRRRASA